jgi:hypothetical protein
MERFLEFLNRVDEKLIRKRMVRDGKVVQKWKTDKPGVYRVEYDENDKPKEVRMTKTEILNRERGQKTAKTKREGQEKTIEKERKNSFRVRKQSGLKHYDKEFPDVNSENDESAE